MPPIITCGVFDTQTGTPASGMRVFLRNLSHEFHSPDNFFEAFTDNNGYILYWQFKGKNEEYKLVKETREDRVEQWQLEFWIDEHLEPRETPCSILTAPFLIRHHENPHIMLHIGPNKSANFPGPVGVTLPGHHNGIIRQHKAACGSRFTHETEGLKLWLLQRKCRRLEEGAVASLELPQIELEFGMRRHFGLSHRHQVAEEDTALNQLSLYQSFVEDGPEDGKDKEINCTFRRRSKTPNPEASDPEDCIIVDIRRSPRLKTEKERPGKGVLELNGQGARQRQGPRKSQRRTHSKLGKLGVTQVEEESRMRLRSRGVATVKSLRSYTKRFSAME
jgi:5-hydroxyisourate hydrolase-like protein (transthyretin family)